MKAFSLNVPFFSVLVMTFFQGQTSLFSMAELKTKSSKSALLSLLCLPGEIILNQIQPKLPVEQELPLPFSSPPKINQKAIQMFLITSFYSTSIQESLDTSTNAWLWQTCMSLYVFAQEHSHSTQAEQEPGGLGNQLWYRASVRCHRNRYTDGEDRERPDVCSRSDHVKLPQLEQRDQKNTQEEESRQEHEDERDEASQPSAKNAIFH